MTLSATISQVLFVDDQPLLYESVLRYLQSVLAEPQVHRAVSGTEALQVMTRQNIDLLICEMFLPDMHSFTLLQRLLALGQTPTIIMFACGASTDTQANARQLRVRTLLNKRISGPQLEQSLRATLAGESIYAAFPPTHAQLSGYSSRYELTPREFDVLLALARGFSNKQIETSPTISASTLKSHLNMLYKKFSVSNRTACLVSARQAGYL